MSDVLITGGNGFVGRHLVAALQARGDIVRVLALPAENTADLEGRGVRVYRGDIRQPRTLDAPMDGVRAVVHLAAMMDVWRPLRDYAAVNVIGTENVCRAALAAEVDRIVHISSSSVYGMNLGRTVKETFPMAPFPDPYPITKAAADAAVQRMIRDDGLPGVILRPDQIFGPGDHLHFGRMADRLRAGRSIIVGRGDNALPLVYVTDVVQSLLIATDHEDAVGNAYNVTVEHPLSQRQVLAVIAREIGVSPPRVHVPYGVLYAAGSVAEHIATLAKTTRRPPLTRLGVAFIGTDNRYSMLRARDELGYRPSITVDAGLRLTAAWYLGQPDADNPVVRQAPAAVVSAGEGER
ncbi:MAG TPA: NAD-dependent epimerase/dehydratase family protein [Solirubrobacteraceae bacterium]|jgi:nucleoside-diphosphate-sugar epimerase|nr:NAD-dependent epimerase/dehydratase family protein [Solirubrobacteraceae bacterium]